MSLEKKLKLTKKQKELYNNLEEDLKKAREKTYKLTEQAIKDGKTVTLDFDKTIMVPIGAYFREYLIEALNHLFTTEDEDGDPIHDPYMNACWTLITLISGINEHAAMQGHTIVTDKPVDETMSEFIGSFVAGNEEETKAAFDNTQNAYKDKVEKYTDDNKESAYDGEKEGQTSSED
jgi:hypothetical protein